MPDNTLDDLRATWPQHRFIDKYNYSWKELISDEMEKHNESLKDVISSTLTDEQLNKEFDAGYGIAKGDEFTVWTEKHVYFPVIYDGAEWCGSVARHPDGKPTSHQGGGG